MHISLFNMILVKSFTGVFAKLKCSISNFRNTII